MDSRAVDRRLLRAVGQIKRSLLFCFVKIIATQTPRHCLFQEQHVLQYHLHSIKRHTKKERKKLDRLGHTIIVAASSPIDLLRL